MFFHKLISHHLRIAFIIPYNISPQSCSLTLIHIYSSTIPSDPAPSSLFTHYSPPINIYFSLSYSYFIFCYISVLIVLYFEFKKNWN